jgi:hypothetical protein
MASLWLAWLNNPPNHQNQTFAPFQVPFGGSLSWNHAIKFKLADTLKFLPNSNLMS